MPIIYPWENIQREQLSKQIIDIVREHGYDGDINDWWNNNIIVEILDNFPQNGNINSLYLDKETGILYQYKEENYTPILATGLTF